MIDGLKNHIFEKPPESSYRGHASVDQRCRSLQELRPQDLASMWITAPAQRLRRIMIGNVNWRYRSWKPSHRNMHGHDINMLSSDHASEVAPRTFVHCGQRMTSESKYSASAHANYRYISH